ncbi:glutathione S-transferase family protein [Halopseudomonas xiamenensis]|uniref:glutathione S-transferase family protein n=1 Tax=Halopseudomonas xiamenensis TaxID=157792 RepID=UPI001627D51B|nr:glutathione S-transferase family protein [Halopseudomonas xiamenensis]
MKLYHSIGPNPRLVALFAAAKGLPLPLQEIDIMAGVNRLPDYLAINPTGTTPVLELEDGTRVAETTAICEYLEELNPAPALIGSTAEERAQTRMWWRRVDQMIVQPMTMGFRGAEGLELFRDRVTCYPEVAERCKQATRDGWAWLERHMPAGGYLCGARMTVVDLMLLCFADFGEAVGQPLPAECTRLQQWCAEMRTRAAQLEGQ